MSREAYKLELDALVLKESGISYNNGVLILTKAYKDHMAEAGDNRGMVTRRYRDSLNWSRLAAKPGVNLSFGNTYTFFPFGNFLPSHSVSSEMDVRTLNPRKKLREAVKFNKKHLDDSGFIAEADDVLLREIVGWQWQVYQATYEILRGEGVKDSHYLYKILKRNPEAVDLLDKCSKRDLKRLQDALLQLRLGFGFQTPEDIRQRYNDVINIDFESVPERWKYAYSVPADAALLHVEHLNKR